MELYPKYVVSEWLILLEEYTEFQKNQKVNSSISVNK